MVIKISASRRTGFVTFSSEKVREKKIIPEQVNYNHEPKQNDCIGMKQSMPPLLAGLRSAGERSFLGIILHLSSSGMEPLIPQPREPSLFMPQQSGRIAFGRFQYLQTYRTQDHQDQS